MLGNVLNKKSIHMQAATRKKESGDDDWLITYSDLVTLVLTFFIMLTAISTIDPLKFERVAQSLSGAVGVEREDEPVDLESVYALISELINKEDLSSKVDVELRPIGIAVSFKGNVLFASGEARIRTEMEPVLGRLATAMKALPYRIAVEGHTDDQPISSVQFPSNWELSTARASRVVRYLLSNGAPPDRVLASGYADTRPKVPNKDSAGNPVPENQAKNRRVEIIFLAI